MNETFLIAVNVASGQIETFSLTMTEFADVLKTVTDAIRKFNRALPKTRLYSKHSKRWIKFTSRGRVSVLTGK